VDSSLGIRAFYELSILCLETAMWTLDCGHRACNIRAITRRNLRAKSHPDALSVTNSHVKKEKTWLVTMLF